MADIYWGNSLIRRTAQGGSGEFVLRDGELFYKITNYHSMAPFLMTVVSGSDHWMYVSSTGGITCGRRSPGNALFPYYTDDKIHDASSTTGPQTIFLVRKSGRTCLWKPFGQGEEVYDVERNLYKNQSGNKLVFEEINHDLGLVFSYSWSTSERFGFVKQSSFRNIGDEDLQIDVLDGLRNLLPYGVTRALQAEMSTLVDAYKQAEVVPEMAVAVYTLSSILTDRAEPNEALKASVVWSTGLDDPQLLLSEDQVKTFCEGSRLLPENTMKGKRGAFFVRSNFVAAPNEDKNWYILADINQGPSDLPALLDGINRGISADVIDGDVDAGTRRLRQLVGSADGCQFSTDRLTTGRHFSNTLFNIMRGGTFYDEYHFPRDDFLNFVTTWNLPLRKQFEELTAAQGTPLSRSGLLSAAQANGNADMVRITLEYLPLTFSRRHGDPSRPWNEFSIDIRDADGSDKLYYQGNWRDIFQNWEALAISFPEFAESFIAKFVNASTADGYNPYRITKEGFEWEVLDPEDPWSNIGYWGDHQVNYLLKLLEFSHRYHPGQLEQYLCQEIFVYADVPYRLKPFEALIKEPRNTVTYDIGRAEVIAERVKETGSDGKLLVALNGTIHRVNLLEKLLVTALSKIGNFVPGGGIWMNTQRPEWNDANNALVGHGLSMVTLCYLRRFLVFLAELLMEGGPEEFAVSTEVAEFFSGIDAVLKDHTPVLEGPVSAYDRKIIMDRLGQLGEVYRENIYPGFSGSRSCLEKSQILKFVDLSMKFLDHSITHSRRVDGLYHSYNLIHFESDGYGVEHLSEMLEGQVAVLSSGYLGALEGLELLEALKVSKIYRSDQNSYMLYPYRKLPLFAEKNTLPSSAIEGSSWIQSELNSGRTQFIERDINGAVHFNGSFRNAQQLRLALELESDSSSEDIDALCDVYEKVFGHRQFTGRSGAMYKYEGLGCIYWHMVSKLLLASAELIEFASDGGVEKNILDRLLSCFDEINAGIGIGKPPSLYGAFPVDPYSHTTGFSGVQQPGMTGQVKEDVITRFTELGVKVNGGELSFEPVLLRLEEFTSKPEIWHFTVGDEERTETLEAGSVAFSVCGVPVVYRLSDAHAIRVYTSGGETETMPGNRLDRDWSRSIFKREKRVTRVAVDIPGASLRPSAGALE